MAKLLIRVEDLQTENIRQFRAKKCIINRKDNAHFEVIFPEGWEVQRCGPLFVLVTDNSGEPVINYIRGTGLFFPR